MKTPAQGQRSGRCRVSRRAERVSRPGSEKNRRRSVRVVTMPSPRPSRAALLGQTVGLAERRIEVDRERGVARSHPSRPGAGEQMTGHAVELANVSPAEAAQERAQGGRRLDGAAEHTGRAAGAQCIAVVDTVTAGEGGGDQGEQLVTRVGPTRRIAEVEVVVDQLLEAKVSGQPGRNSPVAPRPGCATPPRPSHGARTRSPSS